MNTRVLAGREQALLRRAVETVQVVAPQARLILYGSRARGEAEPESDWDLLVIVPDPADASLRQAVWQRLLDLGLEGEANFSALVYGAGEWNSARLRVSPFHANVEDEGVDLTPETAGRELEPPTEDAMAEAREDLIREWLERAHSSLSAAERLAESGLWNESVNRLYYACFDAVRALLLNRGFRFSKHSSVQSLFNQHFGKTRVVPEDFVDLYNALFEGRGKADYEAFVRFDETTVRPWIEASRRFLTQNELQLTTKPA